MADTIDITLPVERIAGARFANGRLLITVEMTADQLAVAGMDPSAGVVRPAPIRPSGPPPANDRPGGGETLEEAPSAAGSVAGSIPAAAAPPPGGPRPGDTTPEAEAAWADGSF